jgi:chromosome segregation ATPase
MTITDMQHLKTELDKWQNAVIHSRSTIKYLEERSDAKTKRIRELEAKVKELGGRP